MAIRCMVETHAGAGIGFDDHAYESAGATIAKSAADVFAKADMIVKVKEPQPVECKMLRKGQLLFTYLHLAPDPEQTKGLIESGCTAIAYETVTSPRGGLPLLAPMSEVAGRMSIQVGAHCLEKAQGRCRHPAGRRARRGAGEGRDHRRRRLRHPCRAHGRGHGGRCHGDRPLHRSPARAGRGLRRQAHHRILDRRRHRAVGHRRRSRDRRRAGARCRGAQAGDPRDGQAHAARARCWSTSPSTRAAASRPAMPRPMPNPPMSWTASSIIASPTCRAASPGPRPSPSTTRPCPSPSRSPNKGWRQACHDDPHLRHGLNIHDGQVVYKAVAQALGLKYTPPESFLG